MRYLWLAVTDDMYELPVYIEDSAQRLADRLDVSLRAITTSVNKTKRGTGKKIKNKIVKVKI